MAISLGIYPYVQTNPYMNMLREHQQRLCLFRFSNPSPHWLHRWGPCITGEKSLRLATSLRRFTCSPLAGSPKVAAPGSFAHPCFLAQIVGTERRNQMSDHWCPERDQWRCPNIQEKNMWTLSSLALHNIATWRWMEMDENGWRWHFRIRIHGFFLEATTRCCFSISSSAALLGTLPKGQGLKQIKTGVPCCSHQKQHKMSEK